MVTKQVRNGICASIQEVKAASLQIGFGVGRRGSRDEAEIGRRAGGMSRPQPRCIQPETVDELIFSLKLRDTEATEG